MAYKRILVQVDDSRNVDARIAVAIRLASLEHGELLGVASSGVSRYILESMISGAGFDPASADGYVSALQDRANKALHHFEKMARRLGVDTVTCQPALDEPADGICRLARYCDLCVLGQYDPDAVPLSYPNLPEYVVMNGGCPVIIVPSLYQKGELGQHCLIAWNASLEARRAVQAALPLLQHAARVDVAVFYSDGLSTLSGKKPGEDLCRYLARHRIRAHLHEHHLQGQAGKAMLSLAAELGADLLVMGCYGHSRFREVLLGGATRTVLHAMNLPVLMAH